MRTQAQLEAGREVNRLQVSPKGRLIELHRFEVGKFFSDGGDRFRRERDAMGTRAKNGNLCERVDRRDKEGE